jgi:hypothetical protein
MPQPRTPVQKLFSALLATILFGVFTVLCVAFALFAPRNGFPPSLALLGWALAVLGITMYVYSLYSIFLYKSEDSNTP